MLTRDEIAEILDEEAGMGLFLAQIYFKELTTEAIAELAEADFPTETGNDLLDQGYRMIRRYLKFSNNDRRTELACEYATIFLASGVYTKARDTAIPYESVFTSEERLVMQESRDEVLRYYQQAGFKVDPALHEPEDHLSFELEFLSHMATRAQQLLQEVDWEGLERNLTTQKHFIEEHLLNWLPQLRETAQKYAELTFYIGMMLITEGFLHELLDTFEDILKNLSALKQECAA